MTKLLLSIFAVATLVTGLACAQGMGQGLGMGQGPGQGIGQGLGQGMGQVMGMTNGPNACVTAPDPAAMMARRIDMLTKVLDLTDAQVETAKRIFTDEIAQMTAARAELDGVFAKMQTAVRANDLDTINSLAQTIGTVHGEVVAIQSKAQAAFRQILNPDQIAKLDALRDHLPKL